MRKPFAPFAPERTRLNLLVLAGALVAGCAGPPRAATDAAPPGHWSGRLAVQVEGDDAAARSFSAGFVLTGSADRGALTLYTPLGSTLAELRWTAQHALLSSSDGQRESDSLQQLVRDVTGTDVPIVALFAWLGGNAVSAAGWQADLSRLEDGRLVATRHTPAPQATLRVVLER